MLKAKKDFTEGPLFTKILMFAIPLMLTGLLQAMYNLADNIVVGNFSSDQYALAAVGSTSTVSNLMINFFIGISAGVGVVVAQDYGAKQYDGVSRATHTAIFFSAVGGVVFMTLWLILSRPVLELIGVKSEFIESAILYFRIICFGFPGLMVYNFGAAVLRSVGDSKTPLIILSLSGLLNVALNLLFVIIFDMSVVGVAVATIASQYVSAAAVLTVLSHRRGECYALCFSNLGIDKRQLGRILRIGIPAGIQSSMYSISNVVISSGVNSFSPETVTASTISGSIDNLSYVCISSYNNAALTVVGQNYGAKNFARVKRAFFYAIIQVIVIGVLITNLELLFAEDIASIFISADVQNKEIVVEKALQIITLILTTYPLCGMLEVLSGTYKGLGYSIVSTVIAMIGACGGRILWVLTFFKMEAFHSIVGLYLCFPITWIIVVTAMSIGLIFIFRRIFKQMNEIPDLMKSEKN